MEQIRKAGVLLPVSALPGYHGIGDFGQAAFDFIDMLAKNGFAYWQILPLNPVGYGHSPYQPYSSYAIDEVYIDLSALHKDHLLKRLSKRAPDATKADFDGAREFKAPHLRDAFEAHMKRNPRCLKKFMDENPWVFDYGAFALFHNKYNASWEDWPDEAKHWIEGDKHLPRPLSHLQRFEIWKQMIAYQQWEEIHKYANSKGIKIIGDVPFYVGYDSCDVWASQDSFLLSAVDKKPTFIAGVPPDYFSETGQRWGNPIWNWEKLEKEGFGILKERIVRNSLIYDVVRLDHFRAFDTYWKIPSSCPTAIDGEWINAPGYAFLDTLFAEHPEIQDAIIAEDLGDLFDSVLVLRDHYNFPGMSIVEFTFPDDVFMGKKQWSAENLIVYLGTHDNDTMAGFLAEMDETEKEAWVKALSEKGYNEENPVDNLIRFALDKPSILTILTAQDILSLGSEARINVPGKVDDFNWTFKLADFDALKQKMPTIKAWVIASKRVK